MNVLSNSSLYPSVSFGPCARKPTRPVTFSSIPLEAHKTVFGEQFPDSLITKTILIPEQK